MDYLSSNSEGSRGLIRTRVLILTSNYLFWSLFQLFSIWSNWGGREYYIDENYYNNIIYRRFWVGRLDRFKKPSSLSTSIEIELLQQQPIKIQIPIINKIRKAMSIKQFTLLAKLGEGAYSTVYKVLRLADNKQYALKKVKLSNLSDKEVQNSLNEVRILASINSPNVISYKQAFIQQKYLCIVMEYADGGDLYQKIGALKKQKLAFQEKQIWKIFIQITRGLKTLHDLKIFHRDLKSANVFLLKDGTVKIGDLNVSKLAKNGLLFTQTGTPYYASPQVWKDQPYDQKSDIWSLGCIIYEMATLSPPFKGEDMQGLYQSVVNGQYETISDSYSKQLQSIIRVLLKKNSFNRPNVDKLLNSAIFSRRASQVNLGANISIQTELLKTIKIPKRATNMTDRLPKSNYQNSQFSLSLVRSRRLTEDTPQKRERQNTLPRLEGVGRYIEQNQVKLKLRNEERMKIKTVEQENVKKSIPEVLLQIKRDGNEIRKYLNRIHHGGNKLSQKYHKKIPNIANHLRK